MYTSFCDHTDVAQDRTSWCFSPALVHQLQKTMRTAFLHVLSMGSWKFRGSPKKGFVKRKCGHVWISNSNICCVFKLRTSIKQSSTKDSEMKKRNYSDYSGLILRSWEEKCEKFLFINISSIHKPTESLPSWHILQLPHATVCQGPTVLHIDQGLLSFSNALPRFLPWINWWNGKFPKEKKTNKQTKVWND